jgi:APA family basic amino acid/polyamine antiporter
MPSRPLQEASGSGGPPVAPRRLVGVWQAVSVCVGMVIGAGIFRSPSVVAANLGSGTELMLAWAFGGAMSLAGALCFAEMAAAFPDTGGDYHFLRRALGVRTGFLFAWSRFAVIHTGSMAMLAFVFGDYLGEIANLGPYGSSLLAALAIVVLASLNLTGLRTGIGTQVGLMVVVISGLLAVGLGGIALAVQGVPPAAMGGAREPGGAHLGTALVFVFLAYGGWSDAATLSAEMRDPRRGITRALVAGMSIVTALYLLANWAYLRGLGLAGVAASQAPAADLMLRAFGHAGQAAMVAIVAVTAITSMNAILIAGARTTYAAARDTGGLGALGEWHTERGTPAWAIVAISVLALLLVGLGTWTRSGFSTMVDFLSPVYWFFLTLSGAAVVVLRTRFPDAPRPFRVPGYPLVPVAFMATSAYMTYSSVAYVRIGTIVGVGILLVGLAVLVAVERHGGAQPR